MAFWNPWERKGDESDEAYEAFRAYLMTVPATDRSNRVAAESVEKSLSLISKWAAQHEWVKRAAEYDSHVFRVDQKARDKVNARNAEKWERRKEASRERVYDLSEKLLAKAEAMLAVPLTTETVKKDGKTIVNEPAKWTQATAVALAKTGYELQTGAIYDALADDGFDPTTATPEECREYLERCKSRAVEMRKLNTGGGE